VGYEDGDGVYENLAESNLLTPCTPSLIPSKTIVLASALLATERCPHSRPLLTIFCHFRFTLMITEREDNGLNKYTLGREGMTLHARSASSASCISSCDRSSKHFDSFCAMSRSKSTFLLDQLWARFKAEKGAHAPFHQRYWLTYSRGGSRRCVYF